MKFKILGISLLSLMIAACGAPKVVTMEEPLLEERQLDTLYVTAPPITEDEKDYELPVYNQSHTRTVDLLHTQLNLSFDWEKEEVIGKANLVLTPYFYPTQTVVLDAKGFTFNSIQLADGTALNYEYDDRNVAIQLPTVYTKNDTIRLVIDYIAQPRADGGSDAITSDKGLFFINPRGEEGDKPQQIWTQGETENNSRWFPTVDKPNERCTQEMYLTVEDRFLTLSNGLMLSSTKNNDGTRTDYWKMDQPHAPYLFMIAVGEFAKIEDAPYKGKPVNYYVEPKFAEHAKAIYPHTPAMLGFFSQITGVEYPWSKYSQVIVRDYVSGAMENTTGVIFGDFMQRTERELIDELINDKIVAHEMFHHWFGDYVTCESWANLTLNEGFANYSEYLWLEHQYGRDEADQHLLEEWEGYLSSTRQGIHPLIHYGYDDKEDMFDAHSYNKGGAILHMLRKAIGDEAFFAGFQRYLQDNAYSAVEVDELRMAFEDVTGEDLNWFFDQWYLNQGQPSLSIDYGYDAGTKEAIVTVKQTQDGRKMPPVFQLLTAIDVYLPGQDKPMRHEVMIDQRQQEIRLPAATAPALIVFDAERSTLAIWEDNKTEDQLAYQFQHAPLFLDRYQALNDLSDEYPSLETILQKALQDPFYGIRAMALNRLPEEISNTTTLALLAQLAQNDEHSEVRSTALTVLAQVGHDQAAAIAEKALTARPYNVVAAGLSSLYQLDPAAGLAAAEKLSSETNSLLVATIGGIYAESGDQKYLSFFDKNLENVDGFGAINFFESYGSFLLSDDKGTNIEKAVKRLKSIGTNMGQSPWARIASIKTLSELQDGLADNEMASQWLGAIDQAIEAIKTAETNPQLKGIYQQF
ncbi:M1 family metallopeptidase [Lewinella sp. LCG006]|uniref:M1 family metallopeptidase n=1 Tax=Lewinella sp. LCG006 TaxID=3231911 RepID=UPI003460C739